MDQHLNPLGTSAGFHHMWQGQLDTAASIVIVLLIAWNVIGLLPLPAKLPHPLERRAGRDQVSLPFEGAGVF